MQDGFLKNREWGTFSGRVITVGGILTSRQAACIAEAASRFGNGKINFTSRQSVEVQGIPEEKTEDFYEFIASENLITGGVGSCVRPIVTCRGSVCKHCLGEVEELAKCIHKRFYHQFADMSLPHQIKISISGCTNNCMKAELNDIGIRCVKRNGDSQSPNENTGDSVYQLFYGGYWGKSLQSPGIKVPELFYTQEEILDFIDRVICFYQKHGKKEERLAQVLKEVML